MPMMTFLLSDNNDKYTYRNRIYICTLCLVHSKHLGYEYVTLWQCVILLSHVIRVNSMFLWLTLFSIQSAEKQGNQLHMNVYKMKGQACGGALKTEVKELKGDLRPAPPYPSRVKTVDKGTQVTPEREAVRNQTRCPSPIYVFILRRYTKMQNIYSFLSRYWLII